MNELLDLRKLKGVGKMVSKCQSRGLGCACMILNGNKDELCVRGFSHSSKLVFTFWKILKEAVWEQDHVGHGSSRPGFKGSTERFKSRSEKPMESSVSP